MALMSVCNCVISVKKCFLSPNNGFLRFCQGKTQIPIKNYILNSTNRITTVLCQKCLAQQAHIIRASTLHPSSTILLLSYIFLCEQKKHQKKIFFFLIIILLINFWYAYRYHKCYLSTCDCYGCCECYIK